MYQSQFKEENKFAGGDHDIQIARVRNIFKSQKDIENWSKKNPKKWDFLQKAVIRAFGKKYPIYNTGILPDELWDNNPMLRRDSQGNITVQDFT